MKRKCHECGKPIKSGVIYMLDAFEFCSTLCVSKYEQLIENGENNEKEKTKS